MTNSSKDPRFYLIFDHSKPVTFTSGRIRSDQLGGYCLDGKCLPPSFLSFSFDEETIEGFGLVSNEEKSHGLIKLADR
jgi:hypothetical protein